MDTLRVSLVVIGILIIVAIYVYSRRDLVRDKRQPELSPRTPWYEKFPSLFKRRMNIASTDSDRNEPRREPQIDPGFDSGIESPEVHDVITDELEQLEQIVPSRMPGMEDVADDVSAIVELTSEQIAPEGEQLFIPLTIVGKRGKRFTGESIRFACEDTGFLLKDAGIYYFEVGDAHGIKQNLLGLANILEPGTFDLEKLRTFDTPGLVLFLHLPAPIEAREAFDTLIKKGRRLAEAMEGDLCDDARNVLTNQAISHLKEKVEAYRFKQKMTQIKHRR
jgi:cell division protein ZipA